jgi:hypothetical protein
MWTQFRLQLLEPAAQLFTRFGSGDAAHYYPDATADTDAMLRLGRFIQKAIVENRFLPAGLATYVLDYICADDAVLVEHEMLDHTQADRAAIGTAGAPADDDTAEAEAEAVLRVVEQLDPAKAAGMWRLLDSSVGGASTMDDILDNGDTAALEDTRPGRARGLVRHYHHELIAARRPQLEALKKGFCYGGDLRPALRLFSSAERRDLYCPTQWLDPDAVVAALAVGAAVPAVPAGITDALRALLLRWGAAPATRQLQRWLTWVTGSDALEPGQRIGVEFEGGGGYPRAQTCTKTIYLPDIPGATSRGRVCH